MTDIVERLLRWSCWHRPGETITGDVQLYLDAAAEIERLRAREAEARTLILSASRFMPSYPSAEGRLDWIRSSQKWLDATQE